MSDIQVQDIATSGQKTSQMDESYDAMSAFDQALAKYKNEPPPESPQQQTATIQTDSPAPLVGQQQPLAVQQKIDASNHLAAMTGLDPGYIYQNMDSVTSALYGKKENQGPSLWGKIANTYNYIKESHRLRNLYAYQANGDSNPLIQQQIDEIKKQMPDPESTYQGIPAQLGQMVYDAVASVGTGVKEAIPEASGMAKSVLISSQETADQLGPGSAAGIMQVGGTVSAAAWFLMMAAGGSVVRSIQAMNDQAVGETYGYLSSLTDQNGRPMDPKVAATISRVVGTATTALFTIPISKIPGVSKVIEKALTKAVGGLVAGGGLKALAGGFMKSYGQTLSETTLMGLAQATSSVIGTAVAKNLSNQIDGTTFTQDDFQTITKQLGMGAGAGLAMGAVAGFAPALAAGLRERNLSVVRKIAEKAKQVETAAPRKPIEEPANIVRHIVESETPDSTTAHYRVTDRQGNEIGAIRYTDSPEGVRIHDSALRAATKDIADQHDLIVKFMKDNEGKKIVWDPTTVEGKALKERLIQENPRRALNEERLTATRDRIARLEESVKTATPEEKPKIQENLDAAKAYQGDLEKESRFVFDIQWFAEDNKVGDVLNNQAVPTQADKVVSAAAELRSAKATLGKVQRGAKVTPDELAQAKGAVETARAALRQAQAEMKANLRYAQAEGKLVTQVEVGKAKAEMRRQIQEAKNRRAIRAETTKMINYLKKLDTSKMAPEYKRPLDAMRDEYNYVRFTKKTQDYLSTIADELSKNPDAQFSPYDIGRLQNMSKLNARELTIDELRTVYNAARHLQALDKQEKVLRFKGEQLESSIAAKTAEAELKPVKKIDNELISIQQGVKGNIQTGLRKVRDLLSLRQKQYDVAVSSLTGEDSILYDVLSRQPTEGKDVAMRYAHSVQDSFAKSLSPLRKRVKDIGNWLNEKTVEIGTMNAERLPLTRGERLSLYMHSLNPDNRAAILKGGFGLQRPGERAYRNRIFNITERELAGAIAGITPDERVFVAAVQKLFAEQGQEVGKLFLERNGYEIPIIENYMPKEVMVGARGSSLEEDAMKELLSRRLFTVGVGKGHVQERVGSTKPIMLKNIGHVVAESTDWAAAYKGLDVPIRNAARLLKKLKDPIERRYGKEGTQIYKELWKGLGDQVGNFEAIDNFGRLMRAARGMITTSALGFKPSSWLQQMVSGGRYLPYVEAKYLAKGNLQSLVDMRSVERLHREYSALYRERRALGPQKEVYDAMQAAATGRFSGARKKIVEVSMAPYNTFDAIPVRAGMQAGILQFLDHAKAGKLTKYEKLATGLTDAEAKTLSGPDALKAGYKCADYYTRRTQTIADPAFESSLQRGNWFEQQFTQFGSETNAMLNMMMRLYNEAKATGKASDWGRFTKGLAAVSFEQAIYYGIRYGKYALGLAAAPTLFDAITGAATQFWFVVRDIQYALSNVISRGDASTQLLPIERVLDTLNRTANNFRKMVGEDTQAKRRKAAGRFADNAAESVFMMVGLNYYQPKTWVKKGIELFEGKPLVSMGKK